MAFPSNACSYTCSGDNCPRIRCQLSTTRWPNADPRGRSRGEGTRTPPLPPGKPQQQVPGGGKGGRVDGQESRQACVTRVSRTHAGEGRGAPLSGAGAGRGGGASSTNKQYGRCRPEEPTAGGRSSSGASKVFVDRTRSVTLERPLIPGSVPQALFHVECMSINIGGMHKFFRASQGVKHVSMNTSIRVSQQQSFEHEGPVLYPARIVCTGSQDTRPVLQPLSLRRVALYPVSRASS